MTDDIARCAVCRSDGAVTLSTGFQVHPECWPLVRKHHIDVAFSKNDWYGKNAP
jgi:hypothetical protein